MASPFKKEFPPPLTKGEEAERVVQRLKESKELEKLETEAFQRLKDDPEFTSYVEGLVARSKAITKEGYQRQTAIKSELEQTIIRDAAEKLFEIISSGEKGMLPKMESAVQAAYVGVLTEHAQGLE